MLVFFLQVGNKVNELAKMNNFNWTLPISTVESIISEKLELERVIFRGKYIYGGVDVDDFDKVS
jgi:hypothetical protein